MLALVASPKVKMINVRLKPNTHDEFKIACELRGGSMSSLMHQFIVRTIREEKEREPRAFLPKGVAVASRSAKGIPLINHKEMKRRDRDDSHKKKTKRVA